ncbi:YoaK family protein [Corynebacterium sp. MSK044]|uniref:YoaK family protein n=1 Tax=Corynebacterium sp. MSK044 TaxID=3050195 RepID=UPI0025510D9F|nr:YoaK family protein [Corynebacterium sp. MSK044]MDK8797638.1 YoaK family protein [Corynebacterium sp. MSK044]
MSAMRDYRRGEHALAIYLSSITGFVDTIGFMYLGGYFLSFMSGNTTRLTAAVNASQWDVVAIAGGLMITFLLGVAAGALISQLGARHLPPTRTREAVLLFVCAMSGVSSVMLLLDHERLSVFFLAFTVGAMNSTFERGGEVSISLTYMTGTLVKMAQRFVAALFGGPHSAWLMNFALWSALACGALLGGRCYVVFGVKSVWIVTLLLCAGTAAALINRQRRRARGLPV